MPKPPEVIERALAKTEKRRHAIADSELFNANLDLHRDAVLALTIDDIRYLKTFSESYAVPTVALKRTGLTWAWRQNRLQNETFATFEHMIRSQVYEVLQFLQLETAVGFASQGSIEALRDTVKLYDPRLQRSDIPVVVDVSGIAQELQRIMDRDERIVQTIVETEHTASQS